MSSLEYCSEHFEYQFEVNAVDEGRPHVLDVGFWSTTPVLLDINSKDELACCIGKEDGVVRATIQLTHSQIEHREVPNLLGQKYALTIHVRECCRKSSKKFALLGVETMIFTVGDLSTLVKIVNALAQAGAFRTDFSERIKIHDPLKDNDGSRIVVAEKVNALEDCWDKTSPVRKGSYVVVKYVKRSDANLLREKRALRLLDHPNVVKAHEFFELSDPSCMAFTMDYLLGYDLHEHIFLDGPVSEARARSLANQLGSGLTHIHSKGVLHRDLKPENVMFRDTKGQKACIIDFGLSTLASDEEELKVACGTPGYVAPEVLRGERYCLNVDCFSLGCVIFYVLCGHGPFASRRIKDILSRNVNCEPDFNWFKVKTGVSAECLGLLQTLIEADAERRIESKEIASSAWCLENDKSTTKILPERNPEDIPFGAHSIKAKQSRESLLSSEPMTPELASTVISDPLEKLLRRKDRRTQTTVSEQSAISSRSSISSLVRRRRIAPSHEQNGIPFDAIGCQEHQAAGCFRKTTEGGYAYRLFKKLSTAASSQSSRDPRRLQQNVVDSITDNYVKGGITGGLIEKAKEHKSSGDNYKDKASSGAASDQRFRGDLRSPRSPSLGTMSTASNPEPPSPIGTPLAGTPKLGRGWESPKVPGKSRKSQAMFANAWENNSSTDGSLSTLSRDNAPRRSWHSFNSRAKSDSSGGRMQHDENVIHENESVEKTQGRESRDGCIVT